MGRQGALCKCTEVGKHRAIVRSLGQNPALAGPCPGVSTVKSAQPRPNCPSTSEGCCQPVVACLPHCCMSLCVLAWSELTLTPDHTHCPLSNS